MSDPFLAQIKSFGFNFPPRNWAQCDGQILPINQNQSLYSLMGTTYGGDGRTNFALPDLRGRVPVHPGSGIALGQSSGAETATLTIGNLPGHSHALNASAERADQAGPGGNALADPTRGDIYQTGAAGTALNGASIGTAGGGQSFNIRNPYLGINYCIALQGLFPPRN